MPSALHVSGQPKKKLRRHQRTPRVHHVVLLLVKSSKLLLMSDLHSVGVEN